MIVFDGHNDTLTHLHRTHPDDWDVFIQGGSSGHVDLPRARRGGLSGGFFAIFTPPPEDSPERDPMHGLTFTDEGYIVSERSPVDHAYAQAFTGAIIQLARRLEAATPDQLQVVESYPALERCLDAGVLALVLHLEGAEAIREDLGNLEALYGQGVRSLGLVWSRSNAFGHGVPYRFPGLPDTGPGLTDAGKALITACNDLGILIDLAHLNERGFWDVADRSTRPLVVSHADVHAICPSTRNLTDAQISAIAESDGVIGVNFETLNTHPHSDINQDVPLTQITAHINYIVAHAGIDHVALGSDFDGATMPHALSDSSKLPALLDVLREQGYGDAALEKIAYKNWLRVIQATWR